MKIDSLVLNLTQLYLVFHLQAFDLSSKLKGDLLFCRGEKV